jgi:ABC-type lipoprotein export system ATPase subunit
MYMESYSYLLSLFSTCMRPLMGYLLSLLGKLVFAVVLGYNYAFSQWLGIECTRTFFFLILAITVVDGVFYHINEVYLQRCSAVIHRENRRRLLEHISQLPFEQIEQLNSAKLPLVIDSTNTGLELLIYNYTLLAYITVNIHIFAVISITKRFSNIFYLVAGCAAAGWIIWTAVDRYFKKESCSGRDTANTISNSLQLVYDATVNGEDVALLNTISAAVDREEIARADKTAFFATAYLKAYVALLLAGFAIMQRNVDFSSVASYTANIFILLDLGHSLEYYQKICRHNLTIDATFPFIKHVFGLSKRENIAQIVLPSKWTIQMNGLAIIRDGFSLRQSSQQRFNHNDHVLVTGSSGSGKTTLLKVVAGLSIPDSIKLELDGALIDSGWAAFREQTAYMYQNPVVPIGNVGELIGSDMQLVMMALEAVELGSHVNDTVQNLSGGERSRFQLAKNIYRVYKGDLRVLIMDEVDQGLDRKRAIRIVQRVLDMFHDRFVLLITHDDGVKGLFKKRIDVCDGEF